MDPGKVNWAATPAGRISGLALTDRTLPAGKLVLDSVTAQEIAPNAIGASELADGAVDTAALANLAVTGAKIASDTITATQIAPAAITDVELAANSISTVKVQDKAITGVKIADNSVSALQIAPNSITASELADGSVDTPAVHDAAITNAKLAGGITGDKIVSITGAQITTDSITSTQLAPNAVTAVELADNAVDTAALLDKAVTTSKIADNSVGALQIAPNSITASELADSSVDTPAIVAGAVTDANLATGINGAKLTDGTVTAAKIPTSSLDRGLNKTSGAIGHTNAVTASVRSGISYDAQGHITAAVALVPSDLPVAAVAAVGGVSVPAVSGLTVSGVGALGHANSVAASSGNGVSYDAHGHVTGIVPLVPGDLPLATDATVGAVRVQGPGLEVDAAGALSHSPSGIAAGTYPKVTFDVRGHVTAGFLLTPADIPNLDASKINTGTFDAARLADRSITQDKLKDYAISFIQEAQPASTNLYHNGMLWYQESTAQLHMWNGNSWMSVGSLGRLGAENMRFCGTFNATTGDIIDVTPFGTTGAFVPGPIPASADSNTGAYFVCKVAGTYNSVVYDAGDWVLSLGQLKGWVRIDTLNGGTSSTAIKDLIDVLITTPSNGETLIFDGTLNKWVNRPTAATKATFTQVLDGNRSTFTLSADGSAATGLLISLGGVIQEANKDYTFVAPRTVNFSSPPPAKSPYWILIEGVPGTGGGGGGGTTLPNGTAAEEVLQWHTALSAWTPSSVISGGAY